MRLIKRYLLISTFIVSFILGILFMLGVEIHYRFGLSESIVSGIVSGFGSLLGGALGGLVAFGVAESQFAHSQEEYKLNQKSININNLNLLISEVEYNKEIFIMLEKCDSETYIEYVNLLEDEVWNTIKYKINNILSSTLFQVLAESYREIKDVKNNSEYDVNLQKRILLQEKLIDDMEFQIKSIDEAK